MPLPSSFPSIESPSPYLQKLKSAPPDHFPNVDTTPIQPQPYEPSYYFFYGTLTKPNILKEIIGLPEEPIFRPAKIVGYSLTWWGQYRALIGGPQGNVIDGLVFLVPTKEAEDRLARYETDAYEVAYCNITFTDDVEPHSVSGKTFRYAGDAKALVAGKFDRSLWEKRMGTSLPGVWNRNEAGKS